MYEFRKKWKGISIDMSNEPEWAEPCGYCACCGGCCFTVGGCTPMDPSLVCT
ncbi:MAG: hypothetical protein HXS46_15405 [Theionarchaea archaeon]|nr:hypothetical protein [Theionarchaea archaeon]